MTTTPIQKLKVPPVGVFAATEVIARSLIRELGIKNAVGIGRLSNIRGFHLSAILVDNSAWPLTKENRQELLPCLAKEQGYILHVKRYDPTKWKPSEEFG